MSRDPQKLKVFKLADELVLLVYGATRAFPPHERFGLQSQLRRAAVSVPTNLVEGCARRSQREFLQFVSIAAGSAAEARYLVGLSLRLGFLDDQAGNPLLDRYFELIRALQGLVTFLEDQIQGPAV